ncbi:MAG: trypsin-like peptidase domain-containing protein [Myxococcota bacterium]
MNALQQLSESLEALVEKVASAVVAVEHERGQGSGMVLTPDGYVVTNAHVVERARSAPLVRSGPGEGEKAALVGFDKKTDVAVLKLDARDRTALPFAETERIKVGQLVLAIGNPLRFDRSVSLGVISAIDRSLPSRDGVFEGLIQTDAAINPGNSGGPLIDVHGRVVGLNTAVVPWAQGIGFAIPASTVEWVAAVLMRRGRVERPLIGVAAKSEALDGARFGQPRAIRVLEVKPGGPAAKAGLSEGDLLLSADEARVSSVDDLQRVMVLSERPEVELLVARGETRRTVKVAVKTAIRS